MVSSLWISRNGGVCRPMMIPAMPTEHHRLFEPMEDPVTIAHDHHHRRDLVNAIPCMVEFNLR